ncbi:calpain-A-like [Lineus longissimus]|uniref:calpain-A-like n=1 Tax=Lineus longissimus TaxID=88925 RepID=UPI002B4E9FB2
MGFGNLFKRSKPKASTRARVEVAPPTRGYSGKQNYDDIVAACRASGQLWEDPEFPADDKSIFPSIQMPQSPHWKRPSEICSDPQLFVGGGSRFDVMQGALGDCWLLAAVASLSLHDELLQKVISPEQDFSTGCIKFSFWQYGEWKDVLVDDRLPIRYTGKQDRPMDLIFMHSDQHNEFWSALLEKAYAKLNGSYENLKGGQTSEAMEDFTGGVTEVINIKGGKAQPDLFNIMKRANDRRSLMGCSINAKPGEVEAKGDMGLVMGHAYSITNVVKATLRNGQQVELVRIRNPWGNEREWEGAWGDDSKEWKMMPEEEKKSIGISYDDDGEFWMCYQDFIKYFQKVELCALGPDSAKNDDPKGKKIRWEAHEESHSWANVTAGGCRNFPDTFWANPQVYIKVEDPDEDDDQDTSTIIIGLMQKDRRKKKQEGGGMRTIGFAIYQVPDEYLTTPPSPLPKGFFLEHKAYARSSSFINSRGICNRFKVPPGNYVIVPSTFKANEDANFLLRIFSEKEHHSVPMDEESGMHEIDQKDKTPAEVAQAAEFHRIFLKVAGEDEDMDAKELMALLNAVYKKQFDFGGFSLETCRSMVSLMDVDESGKLGCEEFVDLYELITLWQRAFRKYDEDRSGKLASIELRNALRDIGLTVSNAALHCSVLRFASSDGEIEFDDYILLCCRLRTCFETIQAMKRGGQLGLDKELFIKTCIYL